MTVLQLTSGVWGGLLCGSLAGLLTGTSELADDRGKAVAIILGSTALGGAIGGISSIPSESVWAQGVSGVTPGATRNLDGLKWDSWNQLWIYPPNDPLQTRDTSQANRRRE